jgi:hypothetical protein
MSERQASSYRKGTGTDAHNRAMAILNRLGIPFRAEAGFSRGEFNSRGQPLWYYVDILCYPDKPYQFAIELEGDGSSSKDNPKRDAFFRKLGLPVLHIDNALVRHETSFIMRIRAVRDFLQ